MLVRTIQARPYQFDCFEAVRQAYRDRIRRPCVEMATGTGKTIVFSLMAEMAVKKKKKVLILCNRDNLVSQAADKLLRTCGIYCGIDKGQERASPLRDVIVGSVQTMQGERLTRWGRKHFDMVITDEVHGAAAKTFRNILNHFDGAYHLGVSATIDRADGQGIGWFYDKIVYELPLVSRSVLDDNGEVIGIVKGGINEGWLSPITVKQIPVPVVVDERLATKGTISEEEEAFALEPYVERLIEAVAYEIRDRKALLFFPTIKMSEAGAQFLRGCGIDCNHVDSTKMRRGKTQELLQWFKGVKKGALCNSSLLTTGYDQPDIDAIVPLKLIKSTPLYRQIIGRGTRPVADVDSYHTAEERRAAIAASTKKDCLVLDLMFQNNEHDFATPACLISNLKDEAKRVKAAMGGFQQVTTLEEMGITLTATRIEDSHERLKKLAEEIATIAERKKKRDEVFIHDVLSKPQPPGTKAVTDAQLDIMRRLQVKDLDNLTGITTKQASQIISRYMDKKGWKKKTK